MAIEDKGRSGITLPNSRNFEREGGSVSVEAAFAISGLLLFLLVAVDLLRVSYISLAGQYVVERSVHWGAMGTVLPGLTREDSIRQNALTLSQQFGIPLDAGQIRVCRLSLDDPQCTTESAGAPGESYYIRFAYRTRLVVGGYPLVLNFLAADTNEYFS